MRTLTLTGLSRSRGLTANDDYDIRFALILGAANGRRSMNYLPLTVRKKLIGQDDQFVFLGFTFTEEEPARRVGVDLLLVNHESRAFYWSIR